MCDQEGRDQFRGGGGTYSEEIEIDAALNNTYWISFCTIKELTGITRQLNIIIYLYDVDLSQILYFIISREFI